MYLNQYSLENEILDQRFNQKVKEAMDLYQIELDKIHEACEKVGKVVREGILWVKTDSDPYTPTDGVDLAMHSFALRKAATKIYHKTIFNATIERSNARQALDQKFLDATSLKI